MTPRETRSRSLSRVRSIVARAERGETTGRNAAATHGSIRLRLTDAFRDADGDAVTLGRVETLAARAVAARLLGVAEVDAIRTAVLNAATGDAATDPRRSCSETPDAASGPLLDPLAVVEPGVARLALALSRVTTRSRLRTALRSGDAPDAETLDRIAANARRGGLAADARTVRLAIALLRSGVRLDAIADRARAASGADPETGPTEPPTEPPDASPEAADAAAEAPPAADPVDPGTGSPRPPRPPLPPKVASGAGVRSTPIEVVGHAGDVHQDDSDDDAGSPTRKRYTLTDAERSRIRWSSTRRGYLVVVNFYPRGRSLRPVRGIRSGVAVTLDAAIQTAEEYRGQSYTHAVRSIAVVEVDALGYEVDRLDA